MSKTKSVEAVNLGAIQPIPCLNEILTRCRDARSDLIQRNAELESAILRLAAVGVAALDGSKEQAIDKSNPYWSPAYGDVLRLRRECDRMKKALEFIAFDVRCCSLDVSTAAAREALGNE